MERIYTNILKALVVSSAMAIKAHRKEEKKVLGYARYQKRSNPTEGSCEDSYKAYQGLRKYRVGQLRSDARILNVAYGYLRGKEYLEVENSTRNPLTVWDRFKVVEEIFQVRLQASSLTPIEFYGSHWREVEKEVEAWLQEGT